MRQLSTVIHPEILLRSRGKREDIAYSDYILSGCLHSTGKKFEVDKAGTVNGKLFIDEELKRAFDIMATHRPLVHLNAGLTMSSFLQGSEHKQDGVETSQVYYIGREFFKALSGLDKEVPFSILPNQFCHFVFSPFMDDDRTAGIYIFKAGNFFGAQEICRPTQGGFPNYWLGSTMVAPITTSVELLTIKDILFCIQQSDVIQDTIKRNTWGDFLTGAMNAIVYAYSADPDIAKLAPTRTLNKPQRQKQRNSIGMENMCSIPVTVLNRSYALGRQFHVDGTTVSGHLRWQPCGEGRKQAKLIWIDEHERHYSKNTVDEAQPTV